MKTTPETAQVPSRSARSWLFFGLAYGLTWLFWIPVALWSAAEPATPTLVLHYLGGLMPPLVAILLVHARHDRSFRRDYWQRAVDVRRIGLRWYAVIVLTVPALTALGALMDVLLGGEGARPEAAARFFDQPLSLVSLALFLLLFGPIPEELAWRGYALDGLQRRWSALHASLILGAVWSVWHLPLFAIAGSYQYAHRDPFHFALFVISIFAQAVVITWIYNNTQRSTLSAILMHFMINFVGELFALSPRADLFHVIGWIGLAVAVTMLWGPQTLTVTKEEAFHEHPRLA